MELTALSCQNYKAFRDRAEITLRPLTILLGKNNAGKSSLARLIIQLLRSFSLRAESYLELQIGDIEYGARFRDLIHQRLVNGSLSVQATFIHDSDGLVVDATIQQISPKLEAEYSIVSSWCARGALDVSFTWEPSPALPPVYMGEHQPQFRGLWPSLDPEDPRFPKLSHWQRLLDDLDRSVSYVAPMRAQIPRICQSRRVTRLDSHGNYAPQLLAGNESLLSAVSSWYQEHLEGWSVGLDKAMDVFSIVLRRGRTEVNIADSGFGMTQALPVVTQQCLFAQSEDVPAISIVEQPELHLHAAAHGALADLYIANVGRAGLRQVVETHSENFLLRVRRRIAEGTLDRSQVALYWIDELPDGASCVKLLEISATGEVPDWPEGVFSEGYREVVAMRRASHQSTSTPGE